MTTSFADLKRSRQSSLDKLLNETTKVQEGSGGGGKDERFWSPDVDKAGNGFAVIRFLPAPQNEEIPWVRVFTHGFQGPGGWFIENSLTTLNKKDPVSEFNSKLWNRGDDDGKTQARKQKRRLTYISNIMVVEDPKHPENEGKVFLYKFGKKIFDKINLLMNPEFPDEEARNPFDLWEGSNFKLKIRNVQGYRNYDRSEFDPTTALDEDDDKMEETWKTQYSLQEFIEPKNFKTYDELNAKLNKVLGLDGSAPKPSTTVEDVEEAPSIPTKAASSSDGDEDDGLSFFQKLADEDATA
jgi:hypothetical protein